MEFRALLGNNGLTQTEKEDFLAYIGRLKQVVNDNCRTVLTLKLALDDNAPEEGCDAVVAPPGAVSFPDEKSEDERVVALENQLSSSMSEFDELLLREMEELERQRSAASNDTGGTGAADGGGQQSGSTGGTGEATGNESAEESGAGRSGSDEQGQEQTASRTTGDGRQQSGTHGGSQNQDPTGATVKRDEPPAAGDDDIVARQLREAAENETDPELREKLWEEYRRYKADTVSKPN